jgi:hypothetical protein
MRLTSSAEKSTAIVQTLRAQYESSVSISLEAVVLTKRLGMNTNENTPKGSPRLTLRSTTVGSCEDISSGRERRPNASKCFEQSFCASRPLQMDQSKLAFYTIYISQYGLQVLTALRTG